MRVWKAELHKGKIIVAVNVNLKVIDKAAERVSVHLESGVFVSEYQPTSTIDRQREIDNEQLVSQ